MDRRAGNQQTSFLEIGRCFQNNHRKNEIELNTFNGKPCRTVFDTGGTAPGHSITEKTDGFAVFGSAHSIRGRGKYRGVLRMSGTSSQRLLIDESVNVP